MQLTSRALINHQNINEAALTKVVPGIVLTGAVFYNEIRIWKNVNELANFFDTSDLLSILSDSETLELESKNKPAKDFVRKINVINNSELISDTIILLQSALTDTERLNKTIKMIAGEELSVIAEKNFFNFLNEHYWNYQLTEEQVKNKALELLTEAKHLSIYQISNLINSFGNIPELKGMVDNFRDEWIAARNGEKKSMKYSELYNLGKLTIDKAILDAVVETESGNDEPHSYVFEAIEYQFKNKGWGERQLSACRNSTPESIENEILSLEPLKIQTFDYYISNLHQNGGHAQSEFCLLQKTTLRPAETL